MEPLLERSRCVVALHRGSRVGYPEDGGAADAEVLAHLKSRHAGVVQLLQPHTLNRVDAMVRAPHVGAPTVRPIGVDQGPFDQVDLEAGEHLQDLKLGERVEQLACHAQGGAAIAPAR